MMGSLDFFDIHHVKIKNTCLEVNLFYVYVVVQFYFWFNLDFPLFFSMLIFDNEYQTKENPN